MIRRLPRSTPLYSSAASDVYKRQNYFYLCHYEDRMRFGTTKSEMKLPFVSTLTFRYLCHYEDKIRFGVAKPETGFPFVSALTFSYLWELFYFLSVMKRGFIYTILSVSYTHLTLPTNREV